MSLVASCDIHGRNGEYFYVYSLITRRRLDRFGKFFFCLKGYSFQVVRLSAYLDLMMEYEGNRGQPSNFIGTGNVFSTFFKATPVFTLGSKKT